MIRVVAKKYINPEHAQTVAPLYREMIAETVKEEGCIEYKLYIATEDETCYVFIEEWADMDALKKHSSSAHYNRLIPQINEYQSRPGEVLVLREF